MRILLNSRENLISKPGGDTLQIEKTSEYLKKLGQNVDISTELAPDLSKYDLVHIFNITRPHETYSQYQNAVKQNKPVVLTPIYQNFDEWDKKGRYGLQSVVMKALPDRNTKELFKLFTRAITNISLYPLFLSLLSNGYVQRQQKTINGVNALLVNSELEAKRLEEDLGTHNKHYTIPNGIDLDYMNASPQLFKNKYNIDNFVLCVANFSSIKNHINLIKAIKNTGLKLVLIGKLQRNHKKYFSIIKKEIKNNDNIILVTDASKEIIKSAYAAAKVHVLPSWFETCGLVSLEAGLAGCNIVSTDRGYAKDYLENYAKYCNPDSIKSIKDAVLEAHEDQRSNLLRDHLSSKYSWEKTANKTLEAYKEIFNENRK